MRTHGSPRAHAASAGEAEVLAAHHVDRFLARMERDVGNADHRERQRGEHQMVQCVGKSHIGSRYPDGHRESERKPPEPHREHDEEHQPEQNVGVDAKRKQYPLTIRSTNLPRYTPATTPSANPSTPDTTQATAMRAAELTNRVAITSATGAL